MAFFHTLPVRISRPNIPSSTPPVLSLLVATLLLLCAHKTIATQVSEIWLSIDTDALHLAVMKGQTTVYIFENIAIGSNGPTLTRIRGDQTTPLGEFTITEIRPSERFELFMAIDYPNLDHTERAFEDQRIDVEEYRTLRRDLDRGEPPSQTTSLGGQLGIHGLGRGDPEIHKIANWTDGCIALTNEQLVELASWVGVGTRVVVR